MDLILNDLQEAFNKVNQIKIDVMSKLKDLMDVKEGNNYIPNNIKSHNWSIIFDILQQFGINLNNSDLEKILQGDKTTFQKILTEIYDTLNSYLKEATLQKKKDGDKTKNIKSKDFDKLSKNRNSMNLNISQANETNSVNKEMINSTVMKKIIKENTLNINTLNQNKSYEECTSTLEFFILSLSRNFDMNPRQSVALLANNRKYLSILCNKGINGRFDKLKLWLEDLEKNINIMIKLMRASDDGLNIGYGTIGTAIFSKDKDIPLQAIKLIYKVYDNIGTINMDWLKNEGIDSFIFTLTKHEKNKLEIMNYLYKFISKDHSVLFDVLNKKLLTKDKNIVLEFLSCIISITNELNPNFTKEIKNFLFEICLNEKEDMSYVVSILAEAFFYFHQIDESNINKTISYFKMCLKKEELNIFSTAVAHCFNLIPKFGEMKNKYAPHLYKILVMSFLEFYENEYKREYFLENFEKLFNSQQQIPIDIFLNPYLSQLNSGTNYNSNDFIFLFKMVEHPRIESSEIIQIINFVLNVCFNNVIYSRSANLILSLMFEKKIIQQKCSPSDMKEISTKFIEFINNCLELFMSNINNLEDKEILEMPFDIINEDFENVNENVHEHIVKCIKKYKKVKKVNCGGLLAMLWNFSDHDDIIFQIEEENRPIYPSVKKMMKKKKDNEEAKLKFKKKNQMFINQLQEKRLSIINNQETKVDELKRLKEEKNKKMLDEKQRIINIMTGIEQIPKSIPTSNNKKLTYTSTNSINSKKTIQSNLETEKIKSNMFEAINNSSKKYFEDDKPKNSNLFKEKINIVNHNYSKSSNNIKLDIKENNITDYENPGSIQKYPRRQKMDEKEKMNLLIQPEGKYIRIEPGGIQIHLTKINPNANYIIENDSFPLDLEEEEDRELKAISGYNYHYRNKIKYYFKSYANQLTQTISKTKLIRMLREIGISQDKLNLNQINDIIRKLFNDTLNDFDFNKFCNILVQISYILYIKKRPTLTVGETYGILLKKFQMGSQSENFDKNKKRLKPITRLLLEKKANKQHYNLPEGFKFVKKTNVIYNGRLAPHFKNLLGESKYICYQILEEIIFDSFNSSIIEPYVEIKEEEDIEFEPEKLNKWSNGMYIAYINLDKKYNKIGIDVADVLEEGLKKITGKKNQHVTNLLNPYEMKLSEEEKAQLNKENKQFLVNLKKRKQIKEKIEKYRMKKKEEFLKRKNEMKLLKRKRKDEALKIRKRFDQIMAKRKAMADERKKKLEEEKKQRENIKNKKIVDFLTKEKSKLNKKNKEILKKKKLISKLKEEEKQKSEEVIIKSPPPDYFIKDKEYIKFQHELNNIINNFLEREDIKKVFDDYKEHLKLIYSIYSKIDCNKLNMKAKEAIKEESFKQFLINFTVLGLLVSSSQMTYIYNIITRMSLDKRENQSYLDYHDFEMALCYLAIFSRFASRDRKILQSDIDNTNGQTIEYFFNYLGLELPFDKYQLEQYINSRRAMTVKNLLSLQQELKKKDVLEFKKSEMEKEEEIKKEKYKKRRMKLDKKKMEENKKELNKSEEKKDENAPNTDKNEANNNNSSNKSIKQK